MERLHKSQLAKICLLVLFLALLLLTPFISTSMRSSYLYFLLNLLIIALGADAGLLSAISKPHEQKNKPAPVTTVAAAPTVSATASSLAATVPVVPAACSVTCSDTMVKKVLVNKKKIANVGLKRCKSRPSLFFIGSCEPEDVAEEVAAEKEEVVAKKKAVLEGVGELSKQELFVKAEVFIGNFYKQLKMQRENSWQKIQQLYHQAF